MRVRAGTRLAAVLVAGAAFFALPAASALASTTHGTVFFNGQAVGTIVTPAAVPNGGTDPFYEVSGGVAGQLGIVGDGPGSPDYRGGPVGGQRPDLHPGDDPVSSHLGSSSAHRLEPWRSDHHAQPGSRLPLPDPGVDQSRRGGRPRLAWRCACVPGEPSPPQRCCGPGLARS